MLPKPLAPSALGKRLLSESLRFVLGRRNYVRLARFLWMESRFDSINDPASNGERLLQRHFARSVRHEPSVLVLDVGANVGEWTASLLAELRKERSNLAGCAVHLFEPSRAALETAEAALRPYASEVSIERQNVAVAEHAGKMSFYVFGATHGSNTLRPLTGDADVPPIDMDCTTLDEYCRERGINRVDFAKIDTEGADFDVLLGASQLLTEGRIRLVQFEYNARWIAFRKYLKDVFDLVLPLGYAVGKVTPKGIERYTGWHWELETFREGNYLLWRGNLPEGMPTC